MRTALKLLNLRVSFDASRDLYDGASAVIAVPFNRFLRGDKPDRSNEKIADLAHCFCSRYMLPFFGQFEQTSQLAPVLDTCRVHAFPTADGEWVQTHRLLQWVAGQLKERRLGMQVILIGHPHHVRRVGILAEHYGLEPLIPTQCREVPYDPRPHNGAQWWCKSAWRYIPWELLLARPKLIIDDLRGAL